MKNKTSKWIILALILSIASMVVIQIIKNRNQKAQIAEQERRSKIRQQFADLTHAIYMKDSDEIQFLKRQIGQELLDKNKDYLDSIVEVKKEREAQRLETERLRKKREKEVLLNKAKMFPRHFVGQSVDDVLNKLDEYDLLKIQLKTLDSINVNQQSIVDQLLKDEPKIKAYMRKAYCNNLDDRLWEHDMDAKCSGTTITLIGSLFVRNKNIKEYQTGIRDVLKGLGFKKVIYKAYEGQSEYTYFDL